MSDITVHKDSILISEAARTKMNICCVIGNGH